AESREQGVKISPDFNAKCPLPPADAKAVWLSVKRVPSDDSYLGHLAAANRRDEKGGERGFYYRIPAKTVVKLETGNIAPVNIDALNSQSDQGKNWRINDPDEAPPEGSFFVP